MNKIKLSNKIESPESKIRELKQQNEKLQSKIESLEKGRAAILKENFVLKSNREKIIYKIIYFRPTLTGENKYPVARLLKLDLKGLEVLPLIVHKTKYKFVPLIEDILNLGLDIISSSNNWDKLPESIGPHFEMGQECSCTEKLKLV